MLSLLTPVRPSAAVLVVAATLAALAAAPLRAQDAVPVHETLTVVSHALGESRRINVHVPRGYGRGRTTRYPVLYMPDGGLDEDFPHVVHTVDSLIALRVIRPVLVVGVPNTERRRDLTGPTRLASDSGIAPRVGGSARFRRFFRDELIPAIDARYRTTSERAIVGESLAGLFVVETFLREPALFDHVIAFDPSLWWNAGALADSAAALLARGPADAASRRHSTLVVGVSRDDRGDTAARFGAALLAAAPDAAWWRYAVRLDLTHATVFRVLAPWALAEALR